MQAEEFKGRWYVSIRRWYQDNEGEWRPTRKGINMKLDEWDEFLGQLHKIREDIKNTSEK